MNDALKECPNPWCIARTQPLPVKSTYADDAWRVMCECGVVTFRQDTEAEAIAAWNTRKSPRTDMGDAFDKPTDDLTFILGQPCFKFIQHARIWRAAGYKLPTRAEDEQAFFIGRMLHHYFTAPDKWHDTWADEIEAVQAAARTALRTGEATDV